MLSRVAASQQISTDVEFKPLTVSVDFNDQRQTSIKRQICLRNLSNRHANVPIHSPVVTKLEEEEGATTSPQLKQNLCSSSCQPREGVCHDHRRIPASSLMSLNRLIQMTTGTDNYADPSPIVFLSQTTKQSSRFYDEPKTDTIQPQLTNMEPTEVSVLPPLRRIEQCHTIPANSSLTLLRSSHQSLTVNESTSPTSSAVEDEKQLNKLKRFLTTLQKFGFDISLEIGDKVRVLVLALVNSQITIEDFHEKLQKSTNFPLRPFVIPFLKASLPLLQRELVATSLEATTMNSQTITSCTNTESIGGSPLLCSSPVSHDSLHSQRPLNLTSQMENRRSNMRSPGCYPIYSHSTQLRAHPDVSPVIAHSPVQPAHSLCSPSSSTSMHDVGYSSDDINENGKRSSPSNCRREENHAKRLATSEGAERPASSDSSRRSKKPVVSQQEGNLQNFSHRGDLPKHSIRMPETERLDDQLTRALHTFQEETCTDRRNQLQEWKHLEDLLHCIMGLVEKCKNILAGMKRRGHPSQADNNIMTSTYPSTVDPSFWKETGNRYLEEVHIDDIMRTTSVQAQSELLQAVAAAELAALQKIAADRIHMEQIIEKVHSQTRQEIRAQFSQQTDSSESCLNCGRVAHETCSGCRIARYCGTFCQHKHWQIHHRVCGLPPIRPTNEDGSNQTSRTSRSDLKRGKNSRSVLASERSLLTINIADTPLLHTVHRSTDVIVHREALENENEGDSDAKMVDEEQNNSGSRNNNDGSCRSCCDTVETKIDCVSCLKEAKTRNACIIKHPVGF